MRVLITGGAGFIGSHTADRLVECGHQVRILDSLEKPVHTAGKPAHLNPSAEFVLGDVTRRDDWTSALDGIDAVIHLAAYQDYLPDFSKFFRVNAVGTALLYEIIVEGKLPIQKVVVASSQAVYGEGKHRCPDGRVVYPPIRSEARLRAGLFEIPCADGEGETTWELTDESCSNAENQYALSKQAQEQIAIRLGRRYEIPTVAMRYSIVQGARQSFYNAYSGACRVFCLNLHFGRDPVIYEDGEQVRDFVNIHDAVDANLLVLEDARADYEVFNVGGGRPYTVNEFARIAGDASGVKISPRPSGLYRFGDTRHICSDIGKLKALGWQPRRDASDSVAEYVAWLRSHDDVEDIFATAQRTMKEMDVVRSVRE
ncbi:MAG: SDR family NAD(P)-dependent oxidoreductase [Myxococcota bacterium]